jgi:hypothetical protein
MALDAGRVPVDQITPPQRFVLYRHRDETGVSGTGAVATGVVWPDGHAALRWRSDDADAVSSTSVWSCVADLLRVHEHGGRSEIVYLDQGVDVGAVLRTPAGPGAAASPCSVPEHAVGVGIPGSCRLC